ncbi:hypothetical protein [Cytophaga aurantiaca]|uniref:hypothetical protein n=1 Tax=Cytophaga aurantiaca TaxID=29530 RepID=UPI00036876A6|nr:hypothetical protein [Cytophaga aurantiaca]
MRYLYTLIIIILIGCETKQQGYSDLDLLYSDFVKVLKSNNEDDLKQYCYKITPDVGTIDYMKKNNFSYRGLLEQINNSKDSIDKKQEIYFQQISQYKQNLILTHQLNDLTYIGREREDEEMLYKDLNIMITETFIKMRSGNDTIQFKLGEMLRIDGVWKTFTEPR